MSVLEIILAVVVVVMLAAAAAGAWVAHGWLRAAERETRKAEREAREAERDTIRERDRRIKEHDRLIAARRKAADAFGQVLELEAEQAKAPLYIGLAVSKSDPAISAIVQDLQQLSGMLQRSSCDLAREVFATQRAEVLSQLSKGPVSCADVSTAVVSASDFIKQALSEQLHLSKAEANVVVSNMTNIWKRVAAKVCDKKGVIDEGMLGAFMDAAFDAVCKDIPR